MVIARKPMTDRAGFALVELMVVAGIVALFFSILFPSLVAARDQARSAVCRSHLRQLFLANVYYAHSHRDAYCPGAADFLRNLDRWHGSRRSTAEAFEPAGGPLAPYLGDGAAVRRCPAFRVEQIAANSSGFERGNGGYGYNNDYLGVRGQERASGAFVIVDDRVGTMTNRLRRPAATIMFTDAAFAADSMIEYSFAHARFLPGDPATRGTPSIHFRHRERANVVWCDGHADSHVMTFTRASAFYSRKPAEFGIGWFGTADDNKLFDLQ